VLDVDFQSGGDPAQAHVDVLSEPTITGNTIAGNGGWGIVANDTAVTNKVTLEGDNTFGPNDTGVFGETGDDAERGDELGVSPVFSAAVRDGPSTVTVALRVTDDLGYVGEDSADVNVLTSSTWPRWLPTSRTILLSAAKRSSWRR